METTQLQEVSEEKDLGIIVSDDLKWDKQCTAAVKQANRILGMIKRNFVDSLKETILALYKSLVRPHLEYCIPVWNPYLVKDVKLIEGVQRRATEMIQESQHWKYDDRLNYLRLMRLERRVRNDLIETFNITKGMYDVNKEVFFELDDSGGRGHEQKMFQKRFRLDIRKFVFSNRVVNDWNSLSSQCVNSCTVNTF